MSNLVLTRRKGEAIQLGDFGTITVKEMHGGRVSLAFDVPQEVRIRRIPRQDDRAAKNQEQ